MGNITDVYEFTYDSDSNSYSIPGIGDTYQNYLNNIRAPNPEADAELATETAETIESDYLRW